MPPHNFGVWGSFGGQACVVALSGPGWGALDERSVARFVLHHLSTQPDLVPVPRLLLRRRIRVHYPRTRHRKEDPMTASTRRHSPKSLTDVRSQRKPIRDVNQEHTENLRILERLALVI